VNHHSKGHPALTDQDVDNIADAYLGGATQRQLAAQYGVTQPAIGWRLRHRGITDAVRAVDARILAAR
jgi:ATP phosphoribosyltransferase regulatory subunit HisZ